MRRFHRRHKQAGIAALEFAIAAMFVMVPVFLGLFVYWDVLQTQQVVTRATGDGARQVLRLLQQPWTVDTGSNQHPTAAQVQNAAVARAHSSIGSTLEKYLGENSDVNNLLTVTLAPDPRGFVLEVSYARPPLLGAAGGLNLIEPQTLQARSIIQWP